MGFIDICNFFLAKLQIVQSNLTLNSIQYSNFYLVQYSPLIFNFI